MSPEDILSLVRVFRGLEYRPLVKMEQCCGFGGTFAVKFGEISAAMVQDKIDCVKATGADTLICNDGGCTLNIVGALHRQGVDIKVRHIASMLDEAMQAGNNRHLYARWGEGPARVPAREATHACCCSGQGGSAGGTSSSCGTPPAEHRAQSGRAS